MEGECYEEDGGGGRGGGGRVTRIEYMRMRMDGYVLALTD